MEIEWIPGHEGYVTGNDQDGGPAQGQVPVGLRQRGLPQEKENREGSRKVARGRGSSGFQASDRLIPQSGEHRPKAFASPLKKSKFSTKPQLIINLWM